MYRSSKVYTRLVWSEERLKQRARTQKAKPAPHSPKPLSPETSRWRPRAMPRHSLVPMTSFFAPATQLCLRAKRTARRNVDVQRSSGVIRARTIDVPCRTKTTAASRAPTRFPPMMHAGVPRRAAGDLGQRDPMRCSARPSETRVAVATAVPQRLEEEHTPHLASTRCRGRS